jgi:hypothetical protein
MQGKANNFTFVLAKVALHILLPLKNHAYRSNRVNYFRSAVQENIVPAAQSSVTKHIFQAQ